MTFEEFLPKDAEWKWTVSAQVQGTWTALSIVTECLCAQDRELKERITRHLRGQIRQLTEHQESPGAIAPLRALLEQIEADQMGRAEGSPGATR